MFRVHHTIMRQFTAHSVPRCPRVHLDVVQPLKDDPIPDGGQQVRTDAGHGGAAGGVGRTCSLGQGEDGADR